MTPPNLRAIQQIISTLHRDARGWRRLFAWLPGRRRLISGWNVQAIAALGQCNDLHAIAHIAPALTHAERAVATAAAQSIDRLLQSATPDQLIDFDIWFRRHAGGALGVDGLRARAGDHAPLPALSKLASLHRSGFVREAALNFLCDIHDTSELPFMLLRLSDWVPRIRTIAREAVLARLRDDYVQIWVGHLAMLAALQQRQRGRDDFVRTNIVALLTAPSARKYMHQAMQQHSRTARRMAFDMLMSAGSSSLADDPQQTLTLALANTDPVIRTRAAQIVASTFAEPALRDQLAVLAQDSCTGVRKAAQHAWVTRFPDHSRPHLLESLFDRSAGNRAHARFHLGAADPHFDATPLYAHALSSARLHTRIVAIAGLTETGQTAHAQLLLPLLADHSPRIRSAAVRGIAALDGPHHLPALSLRLSDAAPRVSMQAFLAMHKYLSGPESSDAGSQNAATALTLFASAAPQHVRLNALRLLATQSKWTRITHLLHAAVDSDARIASWAVAAVVKWDTYFNRTQSVPTHAQIEAFRSALAAAEHRLPAANSSSLQFVLSTYLHR